MSDTLFEGDRLLTSAATAATTSRQFLGAYRKGREACRHGLERKAPYEDKRRNGLAATWSKAFRSYWCEGFDDEKAGKPERYKERLKAKG